ncbi:hypothetical protein [Alteromonas sp. H39]|uniref:hypothetical protein n=1 Tax=Alteromonas sp. H39 TaxID=3389876 RepID=UPI0039E06824
MRYIFTAFVGLVLSCNALAELNPRHQKLADMMLSGDLRQLKVAAQSIYESEITDPELIDIAAEILLTKYPHTYPSEIDTIAWLARAIGASENGRYYEALSQVVNSTDNSKLERHADSALDDLPGKEGEQYQAGMYQLPKGLYAKETDSTRDERIKALMMAGDLRSLKEAAKTMVNTGAENQELTDIAAEILLTHYATAQKHQIDTLAWLTNAIGSSGSARYKEALREVEEKSDFRKLRGYAEKNREKLSDQQVDQYQSGMLGEELPRYDY